MGNLQKTERNAAFEGDTCGRMCEGTAFRIEARQQKHRADALAATIRALQDVVTHDAETKGDFIARVRAVLSTDPDSRVSEAADCPGCKRLRTWAESAWARGRIAGQDGNASIALQVTAALAAEKEAHAATNARLTEALMAAEAQLERLQKGKASPAVE